MASPTPNSTLCADLDDLETRIEDIEDFIIAAFGVVASFIIILPRSGVLFSSFRLLFHSLCVGYVVRAFSSELWRRPC
jgi:hypothetical protein